MHSRAFTYQNMHTVRAEKADDESHDAAKEQTGIVKSHGHGQDASTQGTLEEMGQRAARAGAIWIAMIERMVVALLQLILFRQVGSVMSERFRV